MRWVEGERYWVVIYIPVKVSIFLLLHLVQGFLLTLHLDREPLIEAGDEVPRLIILLRLKLSFDDAL